MATELEQFSELIDLIYRGAADASIWFDIVTEAARWMESPKGMLYTPLHDGRAGGYYFQYGLSDHFFDLYRTRYQAADLWTEQVVRRDLLQQGNVILGTDLVPHHELLASEWYRDCLQEGNIAHLMTSIVFAGPRAGEDDTAVDKMTACSFYRGEGDAPYGDQQRTRLQLLVPHLSRALGVLTRLRESDFRVAASLAAIDRVPHATLLMSAAGDVLFANRSALQLIDANPSLSFDRRAERRGLGCLRARDAGAQRRIERALAECSRLHSVTPDHFSTVVQLGGLSDPAPLTMQLSRVIPGAEMSVLGDSPEIIAFLNEARRPLSVAPELLTRLYGLTPAESRLAVAATAGGSIEELATMLHISPNTAKSHLKQIYAKTSTRSRAELVRMLVGLAGSRS